MGLATPGSVTCWLQHWHNGDDGALEQLVPLVYGDLRRLAARYLRYEDPDHTLQATALVHELYLRISSFQEIDWQSRQHFVSVASHSMRRILIDHARKRKAAKRDVSRLPDLPESLAPRGIDVLDVDRALLKMESDYPRHAQIVELRFFGGLDAPEIAQVMELSLRTVRRDWQFARP